MMTFTAAEKMYTKGKMIKSIVTNRVYAVGIIEIEKVTNGEKSGFWVVLS